MRPGLGARQRVRQRAFHLGQAAKAAADVLMHGHGALQALPEVLTALLHALQPLADGGALRHLPPDLRPQPQGRELNPLKAKLESGSSCFSSKS